MVGKYQAEAERELRQAKILNDLTSQLSDGFKNINVKVIAFAQALKKSQDHLNEVRMIEGGKERHDKWKNSFLIKQQNFEERMFSRKVSDAQKSNKQQMLERQRDRDHFKQIADNRNRNRIGKK